MKNYLSIEGVISKVDQSEISEDEYNKFTDDILRVVELYSYAFGGGVGHHTEEEILKIQEG